LPELKQRKAERLKTVDEGSLNGLSDRELLNFFLTQTRSRRIDKSALIQFVLDVDPPITKKDFDEARRGFLPLVKNVFKDLKSFGARGKVV
jgi:hypothetical protein